MKTYFDQTTEQVLSDLEKTQKNFWNISRVTGEFLYTLILASNSQNVLEIGTSNGYSGIWLGKALEKTGGHLTTIEFWEKRYSIAQKNFETCKIDNRISILEGSACDVLKKLPADFKIDFAFIDANKREYIEYFKLIDPLLTPGGYIACDNILSHIEKTRSFIDEINSRTNYENVILNLPAGLSLAKKITR